MSNIYRLSSDVYEQLEKLLPSPIVTDKTTEHQVGYLLGIQHVLGIIRRGFTVGDTETRSGASRTNSR